MQNQGWISHPQCKVHWTLTLSFNVLYVLTVSGPCMHWLIWSPNCLQILLISDLLNLLFQDYWDAKE